MSGRLRGAWSFLLLSILVAGCGDGRPGGNQNERSCPQGYRAEGPACAPVFDDPRDCPGPNEMPGLGGGCRPVGVLRCAEGFVPDGEGGCEPILPPSPGPGVNPCAPGTMEMIGHEDCQPVGVQGCAEGFVPDGEGGCDAILPPGPDPCPLGTIELLGHDTCQPLGDCGPDPSVGGSPWGLIEADGATVHVDATADASGADGSPFSPYPTVGQALAVVEPGGQVVIAAGEYTETLVLSRPVRLSGRCSALVTLKSPEGLDPPVPALRIMPDATGSEVRGVTLSGPGAGLRVSGARELTVEEVEVLGTGSMGVVLENAGTGEGSAGVTLRRVKVAACQARGVLSEDSTLRVEKSVVRDTLPQPGSGTLGRGIQVQCSRPGSCGSLRLEGSLVTRNREVGVLVFGIDVVVSSSVVRDTLPRQGGQTSGRGINAQCDTEVEACGSLLVQGSLLVGNRDLGISAIGVDTMVLSSVVRDTLPEESSQTGGRGISAQCDPDARICGSLLVEESLVTSNQEVGIFVGGVFAQVVSSVVRDTREKESDLRNGFGIAAGCYSSLRACGSLLVERSLVAQNRELGIFAWGVETTILSSAVLNTLPALNDQTGGSGIFAQCDQYTNACGSLHVEGSLVAQNRELGIFAWGVDATVLSSVVRDTQAQESDRKLGRGISAQCLPSLETCGSLHVEGSLVAGNRQAGIHANGVDAVIRSSVVRDTLAQESDLSLGRGINAQCDDRAGVCGSLLVEGSLVAGNRELGIFISGVEAAVRESVVRDTLPLRSNQAFGRGINAQCDDRLGVCGHLKVTDTLVARSEDVGIFLYGISADLHGVVVLDTEANAGGPWQGERGQGLWALCDADWGHCGALSMTSCLVAYSHGAGVALEGVSGSMTGSLISTVLAQPKDGKYGYGVQIGGLEGEEQPAFHLSDCEIRDAKLAGVLYYRSKGTFSGSLVSGGEYSVAMNEGSSPTITNDNQLSGTVKDEPQWASLYPSQAPPPALPTQPLEE